MWSRRRGPLQMVILEQLDTVGSEEAFPDQDHGEGDDRVVAYDDEDEEDGLLERVDG